MYKSIIQCRYISLTIKGALLYTMYLKPNTFYNYFIMIHIIYIYNIYNIRLGSFAYKMVEF